MTLIDAGPLVAIIDRSEEAHGICVRTLAAISLPIITTWPAFTEAMYLLGDRAGWTAQEALWRLVLRGDLELALLEADLLRRMRDLMAKYEDTPMDLADASLVAVAGIRGIRRVFTLDSDFRIYRVQGRYALDLIP